MAKRKSYEERTEEALRRYEENQPPPPENVRKCQQAPCCLNCISFQHMGWTDCYGICERYSSMQISVSGCIETICDCWESKDGIFAYPSFTDIKDKVIKMLAFLSEIGEL